MSHSPFLIQARSVLMPGRPSSANSVDLPSCAAMETVAGIERRRPRACVLFYAVRFDVGGSD